MIPISFCETGKGEIGKGNTWGGDPCNCGQVSGVLKCEHGHESYITYHCDKQVCPECQYRWMQALLDECQMRMSWMAPQINGPAYHLMISFKEPKTKEEYDADKKEAILWLKRCGLYGGNLVPHGRRSPDDEHLHLHVFGLGRFNIPSKYVKEPTGHTTSRDKRTAVHRTERNPRTGIEQDVIIVEYGRVVIKILSIRPTASWDLEEYELDHAVQVTYPGVRLRKRTDKKTHQKIYQEVEVPIAAHTVSWWGCFNSKYVERDESKTPEPVQATCKANVYIGTDHKHVHCGAYVYEHRTITTWEGGEVVNPPHRVFSLIVEFKWRREPPWKKNVKDATTEY